MTNAHHATECTKSRQVKEEDSPTVFLLKLVSLPQVVFIVVLQLDALNCSEPVDSKRRPQQMKQKEHKESLLHPHKMPPTACGRRQLGRQDGPAPAPPLGKSPASSSSKSLWELAQRSAQHQLSA